MMKAENVNVKTEEIVTIEKLTLATADIDTIRNLYHTNANRSNLAAIHLFDQFIELVGHGPACDC